MSAHLTFVAPPPGLGEDTDFRLRPLDGADGLYALETSDAGTRVFVLDAATYLADYAPVLSDDQVAQLELTDPDQALALVVANPGDGGTTVNLLAPIVVNTTTGRAAQVILEGQDWPVRQLLGA
jgi:flagellar assembly factor FliW